MLEISKYFSLDNPNSHLFFISIIHILTWCYCLSLKGWVSDDIEGIAKFTDRFVQTKDPSGKIVSEEKVDSYECDYQGKKINVKNTAWNPSLEFPNNFMRWFRLNWGRSFRELGKNSKGHPVYGWAQDARKHHALNILAQWACLLLGYNLLSELFGNNLAFISILIFSVHPCGVQTVGWISGVNYVFSLMGTLLTLNAALYIDNPYVMVPLIAFTSAISCLTLLPGCLNFVILILLGQWNEALVAFLVGSFVMARTGTWVVKYRVSAFKEQKMGKSTSVYWRKVIIIVKTFWYYVRLILFPKRLGLFHVWGYHFEEPIEYANKEFWAGIFSIIIYIFSISLAPDPVRFGLIWAVVYLLIFSNIITAQQFVSERYAYASTFGASIVAAYYLQETPIIVSFLVGVFMMRIWVHLPTFQNEVRFYESNVYNFPNSEVAMGNLGVAYLNHGMAHKAYDTWVEATRQNHLYDVPWYNLYSISKQNGDPIQAKFFLEKCLSSKTIHFPDQWAKEMDELNAFIAQAISDGRIKQSNSPA